MPTPPALRNFRTRAQNAAHRLFGGSQANRVQWSGVLTVDPNELDQALLNGWAVDGVDGWIVEPDVASGKVTLRPKPNLVVNVGVERSLDRLFGLGAAAALQTIGVDDGAANPVAGTTSSSAGSTNRTLVVFDNTPVRTSQSVEAVGTFTEADVAFTMKRLFLSAAGAGSSDSAGDLHSMTNTFTLDLSSFSTWSQTFSATVTGTGS